MKRPGFEDLLVLAGLAGIVYGFGRIWAPLAWIVGGIILAFLGVFATRLEKRRPQ